MLNTLRGPRPDITPAQVTAIVAAAAQFLRAFGIYDITPEQQEALNVASGLLLAVVIGDVGIRAARNSADAKRDAAALAAPVAPPADAPVGPELAALLTGGEDLPTDEEEFAVDPDTRLTPDTPAP
jgi:hypothetical protein